MTYNEVLTAARGQMGPCKACPVCDGRACRNTVPGPGAKGVGDVAIRNYSAWQNVRVNMDTICESGEPDTTLEMFGHSYRIPVFAGPVGAMQLHYGTKYTDLEYNDILVPACHDAGILAFTGDGTNPAVMVDACKAVKANAGFGIPTVKPWDAGTIAEKMALVRATGAFAVAMDIDAAGLPFLKNLNPPAGSKTVEELRGIIADAKVPFIIKGVMTARGAQKAVEAGASAIVISNHGGRVLDQVPATAEVLPEIAEAVNGRCKILVHTLRLTDEQKQEFNALFADLFFRSGLANDNEMSSSIARLAVNTCRIMAEIAMIRALECDQPYQFKGSSTPLLTPDKEIAADNIKDGIITRWDVTITAEDFHAVLELVTPLYRHATHILSFLPSTEVKHRANADRDALFEMMGNQFTRTQLLEQAEKMKIKPNTALSWLNRLIKKGLLINTDDKGVYTRTHVCVC